MDAGTPPEPSEPPPSNHWAGPRIHLRPAAVLNIALIITAVAALAVLAIRSESPPGVEVERRDPPGRIDTIIVHVRGAVIRPGVYSMAPGDRIEDAISRAEGLHPSADAHALNLALRLRDEDLIHVPLIGESDSRLVDLNTATAAELERLPGIGPARATAIITARPFTSVEELIERRLIPASVYEQIRMLVTVDDSR